MRWKLTEFVIRSPATGAATGDRDSVSGGLRRQRPDGAGCDIVIIHVFGLMSRQVMPRSLHPNTVAGRCACRGR